MCSEVGRQSGHDALQSRFDRCDRRAVHSMCRSDDRDRNAERKVGRHGAGHGSDVGLDGTGAHGATAGFGQSGSDCRPIKGNRLTDPPDMADGSWTLGGGDVGGNTAVGHGQVRGLPAASRQLVEKRLCGRHQALDRSRAAEDGCQPPHRRAGPIRAVIASGQVTPGLQGSKMTECRRRIQPGPCRGARQIALPLGEDDLDAARYDVEEVRAHIGADSLAFLSLDGMMRAINGDEDPSSVGHCNACFTGVYPIPVASADKLAFEGVLA